MLSDRERQTLTDLERQLLRDDPALVQQFRTARTDRVASERSPGADHDRHRHTLIHTLMGVAAFLAAVAILVGAPGIAVGIAVIAIAVAAGRYLPRWRP